MADAPIDVRAYAVDRRKALAQKIAGMFGAKTGAIGTNRGGGRGNFGGMIGSQAPQMTFPYLQNPAQQAGLGVVNPAAPNDPYAGSQAPGQPTANPGVPTDPSTDAGMSDPIMGPQQAMLPQIQQQPQAQAGSGTYPSGGSGGSGFYSKPPISADVIRQIMQNQQPPQPYQIYGSGNQARYM